jgi:FMN phosphatase YigB (HAD superfamily)
MIKAIIFDVGGVLIEEPTEERYKEIAKITSGTPESVKKKLKSF